jgi:hypothetical protein
MTTFILGFLVGVLVGRTFDLWADYYERKHKDDC